MKPSPHHHRLVSNRPAVQFADGYATGNGRLGVLMMGGPARQVFVFNHQELWYTPPTRSKPMPGLWTQVQRDAKAGRWLKVSSAMQAALKEWGAPDHGAFQVAGILTISLELKDGAWEYERFLDPATGIVGCDFVARGHRYRTRVTPDLNIALETDAPEGLVAEFKLGRPYDPRAKLPTFRLSQRTCTLSGVLPDRRTRFATTVNVRRSTFDTQRAWVPPNFNPWDIVHIYSPDDDATAGQIPSLKVRENYDLRTPLRTGKRLAFSVNLEVSRRGRGRAARPPARLLARTRHECFHRATLRLPSAPRFEQLYHVWRHLFISATHADGLPPNLQGIWCDRVDPVCGADFHLNMDLAMQLWAAPAGNLLDLHESVFNLVERMLPDACRNARRMFGMRGAHFPVHSYGDGAIRNYLDLWVCASGWLMQHYWRHWRHTLDRAFLRNRAWPVMCEVSRFYLDYLQPDDRGRLVISPSESSENRLIGRGNQFYGVNSTFDLAIFRECLTHTAEAGKILGLRDPIVGEIRGALAKLAPYPLARDGRLREMEDHEFIKGHRHLSHLYPLFPGDEITAEETPKLLAAAKKALAHWRAFAPTGPNEWADRFGYGAWAGWSYTWLANLYARLGDGDEALRMIETIERAFLCEGGFSTCFEHSDLGFGIQRPPPDRHGPWPALDAAFGAMAAMQEMLLQSHHGIIRLLPALPSAWRNGEFRGFRAEEGFEVSAKWSAGQLRSATILSRLGQPCRVKVPRGRSYALRPTMPTEWDDCHRLLSFPTQRGQTYTLRLS
ncbi:MAG: glycosyl hydrolase family 95 catalytic domain-containing protein [Verrucomicrobiia bacterium]